VISNFKLNIFSIWVERLIVISSSILLVPFLTESLGKSSYGTWLLGIQFASQYNLLQIGFNNSLIRLLPKFIKENNYSEVARYFNVCLFFLIYISITILFLFSLFYFLTYIFNQPYFYSNSEFLFVLFVLTLEFSLSIFFRVGEGFLEANQSLYYGLLNQGLFQLFFVLVLVYLNFLHQLDLYTLTLSYFILHLLKNLVFAYFVSKKFIKFKIKPFWDKSIFRIFLDLGLSNLGTKFSYMLIQPGLLLLAGYLYGSESIVILAIPLLIHVSLSPITNVLSRILSPIAAKAHSNVDERRQVGQLILNLFSKVNLIALFSIISFSLFGPYVLKFWLNDNYSEVEQTIIVQLLLISFLTLFINAPAMAIRSSLAASGNHWRTTKSEIINNSLGFLVGLVFMFYFDVNYSIMAAIFFTSFLRLIGRSAFFGIRFYFIKPFYLFIYVILIFFYSFISILLHLYFDF
jgi:O-antigen/teichoic acid export membrane protein